MQLQCFDFKEDGPPLSLFGEETKYTAERTTRYYVYIRELVTFMERTVTIVTGRSAITDVHTRTHARSRALAQKSTDNRHNIRLTAEKE